MSSPNSAAGRPPAIQEQQLMADLWDPRLADDPLAFVRFVYPWGKEGTPLASFKEPRKWQCRRLEKLGQHIRDQRGRVAIGLDPTMYQSAVASGRGIGKSALTSWIIHWMMTTRLGSTTIVTANTETQLKSKTWAELGKWHTLSLNRHWFERTAMALKPEPWFEKLLKDQLKIDTGYYYAQAQLWAEDNPDAFAGVHNHNGVLVLFDEASGIPKPIWTVTEGFFTEPVVDRFFFAFSNPRRNTGEFYECFHKNRNIYDYESIDGRAVEGTDKQVYANIISKHGEDSDEARVEVKGQFPRQGDAQFISREFVEDSKIRELVLDDYAPLMMGVDVARFGNDKTVIRFRQGRNARVIPPIELESMDNMVVAAHVAEWIRKTNPDAVCIDAGNGTGVIDRLRQLNFKVHEVHFGSKSPKEEWANFRTFMWAELRDWLRGACIDGSQELTDDLTGPQYKFMGQSDKIRLETKEEMKARGLASPDHGDALALTFAVKVAFRDLKAARQQSNRTRQARDVDYPLFH